jgi:signal transduction histidine kinase/CheY-like chemotaxis protein
LSGAPKTLREIRSDTCNAILLTLTALAGLALAASLLRGFEQGWQPVMGLHIALFLLVAWTTLRRAHLSFAVRAAVIVAMPYIIGLAGLIAYGRGTGVIMFFVSACVTAGIFFSVRIAIAVVALCVVSLGGLYAGYHSGVLAFEINAAATDMSGFSWFALACGFVAAAAAPIIGLSSLLQSLDAERLRADAAVRVRSEFLANMSHELRTPMAGILGMADVLRATHLNDHQRNTVANLVLSARNLLAVLNNLLDFSKFESGKISIEMEPLRISDLIASVCTPFEARAAQKGIGLRRELPGDLADDVLGDAVRIGQVLSNLLDNAVKFTERGGVILRVTQALRTDGTVLLVFTVIDTGIGIRPEQAGHIFEPFIQGDMSRARAYGGSGLGLAICRNLAQAMGGDISLASQAGAGSTFTFTLPLTLQHPLRAAEVAPVQLVRAPVPAHVAESLKLLVVDDDANMRTLAEIMLPQRGHRVSTLEDGAAALAAMRRERYDCLILDMHMPLVTGSDVMRALRRIEAAEGASRMPIVALTADVIPQHVQAFLAAGADMVIAKPVNWNGLDAKIRELAARQGTAVKSA